MKKTLLFAIVILFTLHFSTLLAQRSHQERSQHRPDITQLVSNLTDEQKGRLESITDESRQRVEQLRNQQKNVRDSIAKYMEREGDYSKKLYILFDIEARIQAQISREMYATKVRIDEILTKEQRQQFRKASNEQRKKHAKKQ